MVDGEFKFLTYDFGSGNIWEYMQEYIEYIKWFDF